MDIVSEPRNFFQVSFLNLYKCLEFCKLVPPFNDSCPLQPLVLSPGRPAQVAGVLPSPGCALSAQLWVQHGPWPRETPPRIFASASRPLGLLGCDLPRYCDLLCAVSSEPGSFPENALCGRREGTWGCLGGSVEEGRGKETIYIGDN